MTIPFAIVHHANQFLITNGYENRHGLRSTLGTVQDKTGLAWTLELHRRYAVPANVHISGTPIEAIAWHAPTFPRQMRELCLSYDHNLKQLNEEIRLYETQLGIDPERVAPEDVERFEADAGELFGSAGLPARYESTGAPGPMWMPRPASFRSGSSCFSKNFRLGGTRCG